MSTEEIIKYIVAKRPEISREALFERLKTAREKTAGFISDESLLRMIAAELGVELPIKNVSISTLSIHSLVPNLTDVTISGRVVAVFPPKDFKAGKSGKIASLLVADKSGILRVVLWNDKTVLIESNSISVGQIIRFSHGYTVENRSGKVELHIGDKGQIEINPPDIEAKDYPDISQFTTKIGKITQIHKNKRINVIGIVKEVFPPINFQRQDSSRGKLMRFILADETGEISVVAWNEQADKLEKSLKEKRLQMINVKVKKAMAEGLELHVDQETYVQFLPQKEEFLKISDLREGLNHVDVTGEVATKPVLRNVKASGNEIVKLTVFELKDETGKIWVSAWRKNAETTSNLKIGDKITIKNAYIKKGFGNQLEITTKNTTQIAIIKCEDNK
ncbi:MAG: OB-fold nucleic acid binding domain-containing protein [Candidatus Bathyarchaeia archaeon]